MAGIDLGPGGGGGRKSVDSEINMIPMIDLLMVTISFLLITAVWTHMARINADAQVPGRADTEPVKLDVEKQLHVEARSPDKFVLVWRQGATVLESLEVPRREEATTVGAVQVARYPDLAAKVESEWKAKGLHAGPTDGRLDQAVLHTDNATPFRDIVGIIDAIEHTRRGLQSGTKTREVAAFNVTFAAD